MAYAPQKSMASNTPFCRRGEDLVHAIVVLSTPDDRLMVTLQRKPYGATSGLWQVNSYQLIETAAAQRLIESQPAG